MSNLDTQVQQSAVSEIGAERFDLAVVDGLVVATEKQDVPTTDYHIALYQSGPTGELLITGGGRDPHPDYPPTFTAQEVFSKGIGAFDLEDAETGAKFRASVAPLEVPGSLPTQLVALPTAPVNQVVATFLGIYSILAMITLVVGAFATRYLVTFAFRSLGQVESTAMAIAAGDFSLRMTDIEPTSTEVGRLKTAINAMLGRLDTAITQRDSSVRQMRRFIGDASHELRTPLVTVRGYAELYRMGAITGDDDVAQAMERIEKEAMRMGVLVEDLLALARLDERRDVAITAVDLRPVARDAALDVRATAPQRTVTVIDTTIRSIDLPVPSAGEPDAAGSTPARGKRAGAPASASSRASALSLLRRKPKAVPAVAAEAAAEAPSAPLETEAVVVTSLAPVVLGDENRIRQIVANLLGNARRFTAEDSPIELRIGVDGPAGMGWIEVADHGEGVPEQIRDKIFQRFWRADTSRARETGGTGLGLSIVASIVDALHGTVSVSETPGGGATFRVALPLARERDAAEHLLIETQPLPRIDLDRALDRALDADAASSADPLRD